MRIQKHKLIEMDINKICYLKKETELENVLKLIIREKSTAHNIIFKDQYKNRQSGKKCISVNKEFASRMSRVKDHI